MRDTLTRNQTFASPQEALAHHGVKGQKWGVTTKGPNAGGSSSREDQKQTKRDQKVDALTSRAAKADVRLSEIKAELAAAPKGGIKNTIKRNDLQNQVAEQTRYRDDLNKTAEAVKSGHLTPTQKRLLIGGAVAGGLFAAAVITSKQQSGEFNSIKLRGQAVIQGKPFNFKKNDSFAHAKTPDEVLAMSKDINPNYALPGGQMNCRRCTFAYELRRRGYDVSATPSSLGYGQSETGLLNALRPGEKNISRAQSMSMGVTSGRGIRAHARGDDRENNANLFSHSDAKDRSGLAKLLGQQPDGARGEAVFNFGQFGHSLAYERFGDKTYIFDTQKGQRYDVGNDHEYNSFLTKWGYDNVKDVQVTRLDNADLDVKFLSRWATNRTASQQMAAKTKAATESRRAAEKTRERQRQAKLSLKLPSRRPANMHVTTWNALQREAGLR